MSKKEIISQAQWIHDFNDKFRPHFNDALFRRDEQDIVDEISKVIYSCEKDKYFTLKVMSIETITNYEDIYNTLRNHYESKKKKNDKKPNPCDYISIRSSAIILLKVTYFIQKNGVERMKVDGVDMDVENPSRILEVLIELPRYVNKYYFFLQGNYYNAINQIVDGSTYNNSNTNSSKNDNVTLKTLFMSVRIYRMFRDLVDINTKEKVHTIIYTSIIFKNHLNVMYYHLAKYGLYATFELFHIYGIHISDKPNTDSEHYYCFKKHNLYVSVDKNAFQEPVIQSMIVTILDGIFKDTTLTNIYTWEYWLVVLGIAYKHPTMDKGLFVLDSLESIYDIGTKESIHLPEDQKKDIYMVLKWLVCQFSDLRSKDNVDVSIKRIRIAEYIAHTYAMKLTKGIHRISDLGKKVKLKQIVAAVYTQPQFIISKIILMSNLISYVDLVNDNDATQILKWTYKGISGLGEDNGKIQPIYRFVDPSQLGILDLDTSGASDPGMTGMLCPMAKIYGNSFTDYQEPNDWDDKFLAQREEYFKANNKVDPFVYEEGYKGFDYDYIKDEMIKRSIENDKQVDMGRPTYQQETMTEQKVELKSLFDISETVPLVEDLKSETTNNNTEEYVYVPYMIDT